MSAPRLGRRLLLGGALASLTACAAPSHDADRPAAATDASMLVPASGGSVVAAASTRPAPSWPTRAAIVARYRSARPRQWGLRTTGAVLTQRSRHVCLTFDACGGSHGSGVDGDLVRLLRKHHVKATLFLNRRWIEANRSFARELAADPLFSLQNHGSRHVPLSVNGRSAYGLAGTRNVGEVYDEVMGNVATLTALTGKRPRFFRSGTAYFDDVAARIVRDLGMLPTDFSVNADAGATFSRSEIISEMRRVRPGDVVIAHMNQPQHQTAEGLAAAIPRLLDRGITFAHLTEVL